MGGGSFRKSVMKLSTPKSHHVFKTTFISTLQNSMVNVLYYCLVCSGIMRPGLNAILGPTGSGKSS